METRILSQSLKTEKEFPKLMKSTHREMWVFFSEAHVGTVIINNNPTYQPPGIKSSAWDMCGFEDCGETTVKFNIGG